MKWRNILEAFPDIKKRPGLFFLDPSVTTLNSFLAGYFLAVDIHGSQEDDPLGGNNPRFHDWIALRTHHFESTSGWPQMLLTFYKNDEKALEMFFSHVEEYLNRKPIDVKLLEIKEESHLWHKVDEKGNYYNEDPPVKSIEILKYTDDPGRFIKYLDASGNEIGTQMYCGNKDALAFWLGKENIDIGELYDT